jgi:hypothetical protein
MTCKLEAWVAAVVHYRNMSVAPTVRRPSLTVGVRAAIVRCSRRYRSAPRACLCSVVKRCVGVVVCVKQTLSLCAQYTPSTMCDVWDIFDDEEDDVVASWNSLDLANPHT